MSDDVQINEQEIPEQAVEAASIAAHIEAGYPPTWEEAEEQHRESIRAEQRAALAAALPVLAAGKDAIGGGSPHSIDLDGPSKSETDRVARLLMKAWESVERRPIGVTYVATFADMARAVIEDRDEAREQLADRDKTIAAVRGRIEQWRIECLEGRRQWVSPSEMGELSDLLADPGQWEAERLILPDVEVVAAKVHEAWMDAKAAQGVTSRPSEWGEEQMAPYADLSDRAKDLDRSTVRAVYEAIATARADRVADGGGSVLGVALGPADGEEEQADDGHTTEHDDHGQQDGRHDTTVGGDGGSRLVEDDR